LRRRAIIWTLWPIGVKSAAAKIAAARPVAPRALQSGERVPPPAQLSRQGQMRCTCCRDRRRPRQR
jgi:hypothetical protein